MFVRFLREEGGATAIEYALIASMFAIVCLTVIRSLGENTFEMWATISSTVGAGP